MPLIVSGGAIHNIMYKIVKKTFPDGYYWILRYACFVRELYILESAAANGQISGVQAVPDMFVL